jgi:prepilin-type processing-associated H-X9-DG protein
MHANHHRQLRAEGRAAGGRALSGRGFSVAELLVVIGVLGLLVALLAPAVEAAREAARRSTCLSHLHQLGIALAGYAGTHGVFPTGYSPEQDPRLPAPAGYCESGRGAPSVFLRLWPFLEAGHADALNARTAPYLAENQTVANRVPATLLCPSDPDAREPAGPGAAGLLPNGRSGYLACAGAVCVFDIPTRAPKCLPSAELREADGGLFPHRLWLKPALARDGLSHTMAFSERAVALAAFRQPDEQWWTESGYRATLFSASAPPNFRGFGDRDARINDGYGALSMHPGGVNIALADGAARFVSENISSWEHHAGTGAPRGASGSIVTGWRDLPEPGVWQRLATRAGGDGPGDDY